MTQEIHVTSQNLTQFQNYLLQLREPEFNSNLYFDLPMAVILNGAPTLSPAAQETLAYVLSCEHGHADKAADAATLLDLAERQPILLGRTYVRSGHSTRHGGMFDMIVGIMRGRPFEQNIPAIYTMMHYDIVHDDGTGEIAKTNTKNTKYLNEIFKLSREYGKDQIHTSAQYFMDHLDTSKLLNFETSIPEFRAFIDARNFNSYGYRDTRLDMIKRMNPDLINEGTLSFILQSMNMSAPRPVDTTDAKTQAEKNANILPQYYTKIRDALLNMAEKQEIHDHNNHGALKTLGQRYKELCAKLLNMKSWDAIDQYKKLGIINDAYLIALQRDIIDGNADKLTPAELQMVLLHDRQNFYIRKIPAKVLNDAKIRLSGKQQMIISAQHPENANRAMDMHEISLREKHEILNKMTDSVRADDPMREKLATELAAYDNDMQHVNDASRLSMNIGHAYKIIENIQNAYREITHNFKDGRPNGNEAELIDYMLEDIIYNCITGTRKTGIDMPKQGSLPLFGRSAEKQRRASLESAITKMNIILNKAQANMTPEISKILSKHRDNILKPETLTEIGAMLNGAQNAANAMNTTFVRQHRNRDAIIRDQRLLDIKQEQLTAATDKLASYEKRMHDMSRRHMGMNQTGELTPVSADMTADEKRAARARNKSTLTDKLDARKNKKPARNMAEMLANADMDR